MPSQSSAAAPPLTQQQRHHGLQGPRPATLKVTNNKADDMGLKRHLRRPVQQQQRQPVIIYVESPKVVHAHPGEFKSVVQRLTGAPAAPSSALLPPPPLQFPFQLYGQLPLLAASSLSEMTAAVVAAPPAPSPLPFDDAAGGVRSGLGFFIGDGRQLISPAEFLYDHQSTVAFAGPPSLGACYRRHYGDLFVNQLQ